MQMLDFNGIRCAWIAGGTFQMGSEHSPEETARLFGGGADWYPHEHPRHEVVISHAYWMGVTHVTRGQFAKFVDAVGYVTLAERDGFAEVWNGTKFAKTPKHYWRNPGFEQTDQHPAVCVAYEDAVAFCNWMSRETKKTVRLPTEAEWEHAYRAGALGAFTWGDDPKAGGGWANCADATARKSYPTWLTFDWEDGFLFTAPSATFRASKVGLHDMSGNAWQWCADWYTAYTPDRAVDPKGPEAGDKRVIRGGAWFGAPCAARAAFRNKIAPGYHGSNIGFRIIVEADQP